MADRLSGSSLYQDLSLDHGVSWSLPANLTGLGEGIRAVDISVGPAGEVSLAQIIEDASGALSLRTQNWFTETWRLDDTLLLDESALNPLHSLDSEWLPDGRHAVFYAIQRLDARNSAQPWEIVLRVRQANTAETTVPTGTATVTLDRATLTAGQQTETPATKTGEPTPLAGLEESAVPQSTLPAASVMPTEISQGGTQATGTMVVNVSPSAASQTTPLPILPRANTPSNRNLGLFLAGGVSLLVVVVFFVLSRYRRMS
jgi:hypothetical protein